MRWGAGGTPSVEVIRKVLGEGELLSRIVPHEIGRDGGERATWVYRSVQVTPGADRCPRGREQAGGGV